MSKGIIVLRQTPDWGRLDYGYLDTLGPFERLTGLPDGFLRRFIGTWDETLKVPFFTIRQQLKDLSLRNFAAVADACLVPLEQARTELPEGDILLFTDDDDWYAPDIVPRLLAAAGEAEGLVWNSAMFTGGLRLRDQFHCFTNNYAVHARLIARCGLGIIDKVDQHFRANQVFIRKPTLEARYLPDCLSVANKHPASPALFFLHHKDAVSKAHVAQQVEGFLAGWEGLELPPELEWARPCMEETRSIFGAAL
jgi:hypothetical protein